MEVFEFPAEPVAHPCHAPHGSAKRPVLALDKWRGAVNPGRRPAAGPKAAGLGGSAKRLDVQDVNGVVFM